MTFLLAITGLLIALAPSFEVASIKLNRTGNGNWGFSDTQGGRFVGKNVPLKELLKEAYRVKDVQLVGAPNWIEAEHYDIQAKMDDAATAAVQTMDREQKRDQLSLLLQALLVDRFKLALHHETREVPVYALILAKNGSKLKETALTPEELAHPDAQGSPGRQTKGPSIMMSRGHITAVAVSVDLFAEVISNSVGRVVLNQTSLQGKYDFEMHWTPDDSRGSDAAPSTDNGPALFTAMQEQLGLKLEARKSPLDVLAIDHIERPSEN